jgi:voltage-gated potassium channel
MRTRRLLGFAFLALLLVTTVGVVGFLIIGKGQYGVVDALYMTFITLTTVGFGEVIDMSANPVGRLFTIALLLGGMGIVTYTMLILATFMIEGHVGHVFWRRRMLKRIARMAEHYMVCGQTTTAWYVTEELENTGRPVVMVVPTEEGLQVARDRLGDIPGVVGDPSDDDVLQDAGIAEAIGIVFCMENDKDNLLGVLTARRLSSTARIIATTELPENIGKLKTAGANAVVSPSHIGGLRMASELIRPTVVSFLDEMLRVGGGSLRVEEVVVPEEISPSPGTLSSLEIDDIPNAVLLAVCPAGSSISEFKPDLMTPIRPGMKLIIMSDADGRKHLEECVQAL